MTKRRASCRAFQHWHRRVKNVSVDVALSIYDALATPLSLSLSSALREGRYLDVVSAGLNPLTYDDPDSFRDDYLACELMSKFPSWDTGVDRVQVALEKFQNA